MAELSRQGRDEDNSRPGFASGDGAAVAARLAPGARQATSKKPIVRSKMVDWYDPVQLAKTGIGVVISTILGRSSDYRMLEAIDHSSDRLLFYDHTCAYKGENEEYSVDDATPREQKEIWIDYAADVGDGFNSTYTVASYMSQPELYVKTAEGGREHQTRRGEILIFGGDGVYPTASRQGYDERLVRPYEAALRVTDKPHPHVY